MAFVRIFGKFLISVGVGILLFVGWTLWGTGFYTAGEQRALTAEFDRLLQRPVGTPVGSREEPARKPPKNYLPDPGEPVFRLRIPSIDVDQIVVEGVGVEVLKKGPGHYPSCRPGFERPLCTDVPAVWPGGEGRVIVSGHRTTYGAPFWSLDRLERGDEILTQTRWGDFTYVVTTTRIVAPDAKDIAVPDATDTSELVLTTCNPRFSAAQRLIVYARMETA